MATGDDLDDLGADLDPADDIDEGDLATLGQRILRRLARLDDRIRLEGEAWRRALARVALSLALAGILVTVGTAFVVRTSADNDSQRRTREERIAGITRARLNCEAVNEANRDTLGLLLALLDGADKRDAAVLSPAAARAAKAERDKGRQLGMERLAPDDCAARHPFP